MKSFIFILFMLPAFLNIFSQDDVLPAQVESTFKARYPLSKLDNWRLEENLYYIEFYLKGSMYTAVFDQEGVWEETSEVISDFEVPSALTQYIKKNHPEAKISYCEKVDCHDLKKYIRVCILVNYESILLISNPDGSNIRDITPKKISE